jgi:hypothetical protein
MKKLELQKTGTVEGVELVIYPKQARLNGRAILSKGLAAVYRARASAKGLDLERLLAGETEATLLDQADMRAVFVPAIDLDTGEVDWDKVEQAAKEAAEAGITLFISWWDEESRVKAETIAFTYGHNARYTPVEGFRAAALQLEPTWSKDSAVFITVNPRTRIKQDVADAFVNALPSGVNTLVTLARISNLPFIQAAKAKGLRVVVLDPGLLSSWREETRKLLDGVEVMKTADTYTPGSVTQAVRFAVANVSKAMGVEPEGLRSEAGLVPNNMWAKIKAFADVR